MMSVWNHVRSCEVWCHVMLWGRVMSCEVVMFFCMCRLRCWTNTCFFRQSQSSTSLTSLKETTFARRTSGQPSHIKHTHTHTPQNTKVLRHIKRALASSLDSRFGFVAWSHNFTLTATTLFFSSRLSKIKEWIDTRDPHAVIIPFSGALESKVCSHTPSEWATPTIV